MAISNLGPLANLVVLFLAQYIMFQGLNIQGRSQDFKKGVGLNAVSKLTAPAV